MDMQRLVPENDPVPTRETWHMRFATVLHDIADWFDNWGIRAYAKRFDAWLERNQ